MTVQELLDILKDCAPHEEVSFQIQEGCCGDTRPLEISYTDTFDYKCDRYPIITFKQLPGFRSCIQSGGTLQADKEYWKKFGKKVD